MKIILKTSLIVSAITLLSGCGTLSGFDASSDFACKAQPGVSCKSISGVYQNAEQGNLPSQQAERHISGTSFQKVEKVSRSVTGQAPASGTPLFQKPVTLRVWFSPWEDDKGVLHDQQYSYLLIQKAKWDIEHFKDAKYRSGFSLNQ
ncbi:hypothetical protein JCM30760_25950 [Thiomicrorhabdus hydrogeniphila]